MCSLYTIKTPFKGAAVLETVAHWRFVPNAEESAIRPTDIAPVLIAAAEGREIIGARWGFPPPPSVGGKNPVINARNLSSAFWRPALKRRALVPVSRFCEWDERRRPHWFGTCDGAIFCFAGVIHSVEGEDMPRFAFATTESAGVVLPVHPKAMPAVLASADAASAWLSGAALEEVHQRDALIEVDAPSMAARGVESASKTSQPSLFNF